MSKPKEPKFTFVVPPSLRNFKWRQESKPSVDKRMSVELQRTTKVGSLDPQMYPKDAIPESDELMGESSQGRLMLKFTYDKKEECLAVNLAKIRFVPRRSDESAPDIYFDMAVFPHERRQYQSQVYESTTDRDFDDDDESFVFQMPQVPNGEWSLCVKLFDTSIRKPIGAALIPLAPIASSLMELPNISGNTDSVAFRYLDLLPIQNGEQVAVVNALKCDKASTTPPATNSPTGSRKIVQRFIELNEAFQQQLSVAGLVPAKNCHQHHSGNLQVSFCLSKAAHRLSISVHDFEFNCLPLQEHDNGHSSAGTELEGHSGMETFARLTLFEQGHKELKSKRTRNVKVEKFIKKNEEGADIEAEHCSFTELVVLKDLPDADHMLESCGIRIQVVKSNLCSRDKPISRAFIGSAIFCRGPEQAMWEEILCNDIGEPRAYQIRLNPIFDGD